MSDEAACYLIGALFLMIVVFLVGCWAGVAAERTAAIKAGAGQWVSDQKTGETTFVYGKAGPP